MFALAASASAAKIDCSTFTAHINGDVRYSTIEEFPKPSEKTHIDLTRIKQPFNQTVCGVRIKAVPGEYSYQAASVKDLLQATGSTGGGWETTLFGVVQSGGKVGYVEAANLSIQLPDGLLHDNVRIYGYYKRPYLPSDAMMAVRIDNGKLLPLLFNGSFRTITVDPKMNTLQIYLKSSKPMLWGRVVIDVKNGKMTITQKAPFPAK